MIEDLINILRTEVCHRSPDELIILAKRHFETMSQFQFIRLFFLAFPTVPLRYFKEASASRHLIGEAGLDASEIDELLGPWLKGAQNQ